MPQSEFEKRLKKVRRAMKRQGIDLLLLYGNAFDEYGNYCYLSNYVVRLPRGAMVVVPAKREISLLFEGAPRGIPSVKKTTWIEDVRASGDVSKECVKYMKDNHLTPTTVGFVGLKQLMPHAQLRFLSDALGGVQVVDADDLLREMRMVKSQREVDQIRRVSRIVSHAFGFISEISCSPKSAQVLEAAVRREARLEGAEDFRMMIASPREGSWAFHPPEEKEIIPRGTLIIYLAVQFERYWAQAIRTFVTQETSFEKTQSERLQTLYKKMGQHMKPGKVLSQFYQEMVEMIHKENVDFILDYGIGQGIGLSPKEYPVIAGEDQTKLAEGMCFSFLLGIKDKDLEAAMIGNTLLLKKKGPEVLTADA